MCEHVKNYLEGRMHNLFLPFLLISIFPTVCINAGNKKAWEILFTKKNKEV